MTNLNARVLGGLVTVLALVVGIAPAPVHAGGTDWVFDAAAYRPGERVSAWAQIDRTLVRKQGYAARRVAYYAFAVPWDSQGVVRVPDDGTLPDEAVRLGRVRLQRGIPKGTKVPGPDHFTLTFSAPELPVGRYAVLECNVPCTRPMPFITGGSFEIM
jgi:hypothetical protein